MEYANNFCNIDVEKQDKTIILKSGKCKIDDFQLHNNIFDKYEKLK